MAAETLPPAAHLAIVYSHMANASARVLAVVRRKLAKRGAQAAFSRKANVHPSWVSQLVKYGKGLEHLDKLDIISKGLGLDVRDLLENTGTHSALMGVPTHAETGPHLEESRASVAAAMLEDVQGVSPSQIKDHEERFIEVVNDTPRTTARRKTSRGKVPHKGHKSTSRARKAGRIRG